jgi:hypothetical protein
VELAVNLLWVVIGLILVGAALPFLTPLLGPGPGVSAGTGAHPTSAIPIHFYITIPLLALNSAAIVAFLCGQIAGGRHWARVSLALIFLVSLFSALPALFLSLDPGVMFKGPILTARLLPMALLLGKIGLEAGAVYFLFFAEGAGPWLRPHGPTRERHARWQGIAAGSGVVLAALASNLGAHGPRPIDFGSIPDRLLGPILAIHIVGTLAVAGLLSLSALSAAGVRWARVLLNVLVLGGVLLAGLGVLLIGLCLTMGGGRGWH